jgi:preprotein translocase subunit SecG
VGRWLCDEQNSADRTAFSGDNISSVRDVMLYVMLVINIVSMIGTISGVLLHSGRGGGLSDMFGGGGGAALGSTAAERNLNRITTVFALSWILSVLALSFLYVR